MPRISLSSLVVTLPNKHHLSTTNVSAVPVNSFCSLISTGPLNGHGRILCLEKAINKRLLYISGFSFLTHAPLHFPSRWAKHAPFVFSIPSNFSHRRCSCTSDTRNSFVARTDEKTPMTSGKSSGSISATVSQNTNVYPSSEIRFFRTINLRLLRSILLYKGCNFLTYTDSVNNAPSSPDVTIVSISRICWLIFISLLDE